MKLVSTRPFSPAVLECLRAEAPDLEIVSIDIRDFEACRAELASADILYGSFGGGSGSIFAQVVSAAQRVQWIHTTSAGVDEILCPELYERPLILTCGKGHAVGPLLAEHAMAMMLSLSRCLVQAARTDHWDREGFSTSSPHHPFEIGGLTMGIVGLGGVGAELARRAAAFDVRVIGVRRNAGPPPPHVEAIWGVEELPRLLAESDIVVLLLPNTPETAGSFGEADLRGMKSSAWLINVGRGQVVDGAALERALVEGWIAGAGLDVMPEEPWPAESPLWRMNNVLITPHIAGNSSQRAGRDMEVFCENVGRFVRGEPLASVVNLQAGY
jgi:phosphoglycerate dehydrogenase-like enzyme